MDMTSVVEWVNMVHSVLGFPSPKASSPKDALDGCKVAYTNYLQQLRTDSSIDVNLVWRTLQCTGGLTKWRLPVEGVGDLSKVAEKGFIARNLLAKTAGLPFKDHVVVGDKLITADALYERMRLILADWLPVPTDSRPCPKLGPGAVYEKLNFTQKREALGAIFSRLECERRFYGYPTSRYEYCSLRDIRFYPAMSVQGTAQARLCAVPKDYDKDRLITVEPIFNTVAQQMAREYLLDSFSLGLRRRPRIRTRRGAARTVIDGPIGLKASLWRDFNAKMPLVQRRRAILGSGSNPEFATIDLSNASDGVTYEFVARVMPAHVMDWLDYSRTPCFVDSRKRVARLYIYGGMGNATTFMVETLMFAAYVVAISWFARIKPLVTVFGDDIICNSRLVSEGWLQAPLREGNPFFEINLLKSFYGKEPFRESCGVFGYAGHDVTFQRVRGYKSQTDPASLLGACELLRTWIEDVSRDDDAALKAARMSLVCAFQAELAGSQQQFPGEKAESQHLVSVPRDVLLAGTLAVPEVRWPEVTSLPVAQCKWRKSTQRLEWKVPYLKLKTRHQDPTRGWQLDAYFAKSLRTEEKVSPDGVLIDRYVNLPQDRRTAHDVDQITDGKYRIVSGCFVSNQTTVSELEALGFPALKQLLISSIRKAYRV